MGRAKNIIYSTCRDWAKTPGENATCYYSQNPVNKIDFCREWDWSESYISSNGSPTQVQVPMGSENVRKMCDMVAIYTQHCSPTWSLSFSTRSPWWWFLKSVRSEISETSNQKSVFWASRASILILQLATTRSSYPTYLLQLDGKEVNFPYSLPSSKIVALMRIISNEWMPLFHSKWSKF